MSDLEDFREKKLLGKAFMLATNFIAGFLVMGFLGYLVDRWLDKEPVFLLTGLGLGFTWAIYESVKFARSYDR